MDVLKRKGKNALSSSGSGDTQVLCQLGWLVPFSNPCVSSYCSTLYIPTRPCRSSVPQLGQPAAGDASVRLLGMLSALSKRFEASDGQAEVVSLIP